jgi:hypothetical protein
MLQRHVSCLRLVLYSQLTLDALKDPLALRQHDLLVEGDNDRQRRDLEQVGGLVQGRARSSQWVGFEGADYPQGGVRAVGRDEE